jgi:hypothetical protein
VSNWYSGLAIIGVFYFLTRLVFVYCLPMGDAPDELCHYTVAEFLKDHYRLPSATEVEAGGQAFVYGSLPALGYLPNAICGWLANLISPELPFRLVSRWATLLCGFPGVVAAFFLGRELFQAKYLAFLLPLLVVFHPQLVFTESYTNTDAVVNSLCSINFYILVRAYRLKLAVREAFSIGFLTALACLSKTNALSLVPAFIFAIFCTSSSAFSSVSAFLGVMGICLAPYYWRNYCEFHGDWLGSATMYNTWKEILPIENGVVKHPWPKLISIAWWRFLLFDFFGLFGLMDKYLWRPFYLLFAGGILVSLWGHFKFLWCNSKICNLRAVRRSPYVFFAVALLFNLLATVYVTLSNTSGPHGRYLFPCELPILALILAGFERMGRKPCFWLSLGLLLLFAMALGSGWYSSYSMHHWYE